MRDLTSPSLMILKAGLLLLIQLEELTGALAAAESSLDREMVDEIRFAMSAFA